MTKRKGIRLLAALALCLTLCFSFTVPAFAYRVTGSGEELEPPSTITVLVVEPDKKPYVKEIPSSLESLQHEVGGDIEAVYPFEEPVAIVCNEEGKMNGLPLNRALRDDSGEIYDIVAGTFLVTGLTDDSFGSLSPDLLRQFMTEFKMPEQFAKIGDRIVAIPMISEEQQKQTVLEEKSSIVNENTSGMAVDGHIGTWHTIDHKEIDGHTFWLMEHDTFGDDASCIIVDERGELVLSHIYDGFDETAVNLLRQEVMPVEKMPDDSISIEDMKQYGYKWGGSSTLAQPAFFRTMPRLSWLSSLWDAPETAWERPPMPYSSLRKAAFSLPVWSAVKYS